MIVSPINEADVNLNLISNADSIDPTDRYLTTVNKQLIKRDLRLLTTTTKLLKVNDLNAKATQSPPLPNVHNSYIWITTTQSNRNSCVGYYMKRTLYTYFSLRYEHAQLMGMQKNPPCNDDNSLLLPAPPLTNTVGTKHTNNANTQPVYNAMHYICAHSIPLSRYHSNPCTPCSW
jgi:hypothetical protein